MINLKKIKKPFIIAEIGINHEGKFVNAKKLILEAKKSGADAVKFQVFKPHTLANKKLKKNKLQIKSLKKKEDLYEMWKRVSLNEKELFRLRVFAKKIKIFFICSVFDLESLNLIKKLNVDAYKIASSDITDYFLQSHISKEKKPVILSTGMANEQEIKLAVKNIKNRNISILHCVSLYPCDIKFANLNRIKALYKKFNLPIGYSDHCIGVNASIIAMTMGAKVIEKHFTLNKKKIGLDHALSADPDDLKIISDFAEQYNLFKGKNSIEPTRYEKSFQKFFRKGIYFKKNIKKNKKLDSSDLIIRRPKNNTAPKYYNKIINKVASRSFRKNENVNLNFLRKK
jgi:sialic acid synthase SpsE